MNLAEIWGVFSILYRLNISLCVYLSPQTNEVSTGISKSLSFAYLEENI